MATYYVGADVHSNNTELAIEQRGRIVARYSVPTTIPAIGTVLDSFQGRKIFAMEEGPMAGWLCRNLNEKVEKFVVSEPRRNKFITCEGDKDDKIDAGKLASLLRGNFLKAVHHSSDSHRAHLKHWINLYHDRVRDAVRYINKIRACCRMHGVRITTIDQDIDRFTGLGRKEDAIREGKLAVELLPLTKEAWGGLFMVENLARIYMMVGDSDAANDQLEFLLSIPGEISIPLLTLDPAWDLLRNHPRFKELMKSGK